MTDNQNPARQTKTLASKEELNEIARALQDLWSVVKPEPRPSPFDAVWREYAAEIRRVVLKNTPPQEHVVAAWRYRYEPHLTWHVAEFVDQLPRKELFPLLQIEALYAEPPAPEPHLRGDECQYALDQGTPEHRCAARCVYEEKGFAAGIEQAAQLADRYDETETLSAPKAIASAIRELTREGQS